MKCERADKKDLEPVAKQARSNVHYYLRQLAKFRDQQAYRQSDGCTHEKNRAMFYLVNGDDREDDAINCNRQKYHS